VILGSKELSSMFPHTSLLLLQHTKASFCINDEFLFNNQGTPNKGGYDLFKTFAVDYLTLINHVYNVNIISEKTFCHLKWDLLFNFLPNWYCDTKIFKNNYTYILTNIRRSINTYFPFYGYYILIFLAYKVAITRILGNRIRRLFVL